MKPVQESRIEVAIWNQNVHWKMGEIYKYHDRKVNIVHYKKPNEQENNTGK